MLYTCACSISQVYRFLVDTYTRTGWVPRWLYYDDACHLQAYAYNRKRFMYGVTSVALRYIAMIAFLLDR